MRRAFAALTTICECPPFRTKTNESGAEALRLSATSKALEGAAVGGDSGVLLGTAFGWPADIGHWRSGVHGPLVAERTNSTALSASRSACRLDAGDYRFVGVEEQYIDGLKSDLRQHLHVTKHRYSIVSDGVPVTRTAFEDLPMIVTEKSRRP